jgi:HD-like signal output (HDOD) protein
MPALARDPLAVWTARLRDATIPVLDSTASSIARLADAEQAHGQVDARTIADAVGTDPLMTLKLLAYVCTHRNRSRTTDAETTVAALMLLGVGPFFREFGAVSTVQTHLAHAPLALAGLHRVIRRAHRAARFALGFAVHRMDGDADVMHGAALLHDFAEMLLWCHAPALALEIAARQRADAALRSADAQRSVLGLELAALEQALMKAWRLPELLIRVTNDHADGRAADDPQVRTVRLAVQLARHTQDGWRNAALPDDLQAIAHLLTLSTAAAERLVHDLDRV